MYSKVIDKIVWWIPFKNLRNLIRVILINILELKLNNTDFSKFCNSQNKILDNNVYEYDFIFSIGENCFCADILNKNKLRITSSPFDWLTPNRDYSKTNMISNLQIINNKFKDFLIKDNFIYIGDSVKDGVKIYLNNMGSCNLDKSILQDFLCLEYRILIQNNNFNEFYFL